MSMGSKTISSQRLVSLTINPSRFVEAIPNRIGLIVSASSTYRFTISLETLTDTIPVLDQGINLYVGNEPLILTLEEHGDLVTRAWSAVAEATVDVAVIETFLK